MITYRFLKIAGILLLTMPYIQASKDVKTKAELQPQIEQQIVQSVNGFMSNNPGHSAAASLNYGSHLKNTSSSIPASPRDTARSNVVPIDPYLSAHKPSDKKADKKSDKDSKKSSDNKQDKDKEQKVAFLGQGSADKNSQTTTAEILAPRGSINQAPDNQTQPQLILPSNIPLVEAMVDRKAEVEIQKPTVQTAEDQKNALDIIMSYPGFHSDLVYLISIFAKSHKEIVEALKDKKKYEDQAFLDSFTKRFKDLIKPYKKDFSEEFLKDAAEDIWKNREQYIPKDCCFCCVIL